MKKKVLFIAAITTLVLAGCTNAGPVGKFGGEKGKKVIAGKTIRPPYTDVKSYYGYAKAGAEADEVKNGRKYNPTLYN